MSLVLKLKLTELKKTPSKISESKIPLCTKMYAHVSDIKTNYSDVKTKMQMDMMSDVSDHLESKCKREQEFSYRLRILLN